MIEEQEVKKPALIPEEDPPGFYSRHQITSQDTTRLFLTSDSTRPLNNYQKELFDIWNKYHFYGPEKNITHKDGECIYSFDIIGGRKCLNE